MAPIAADVAKTSVQDRALLIIQRWWRTCSYRWLLDRRSVRLPASAHNGVDIPLAGEGALAWHHRLSKAYRAMTAARANFVDDPAVRLQAEFAYCLEVGRFVGVAQAAAMMAIHEAIVDPSGSSGAGDGHTWPARVTSSDPLWPFVRPRFDGDRVFRLDSVIVTVVMGNVGGKQSEGGMDHEMAWKLAGHDLKGMQALADAIARAPTAEPILPPVGVLVDYMGFRAMCRPQLLTEAGPPAELVLGPFEEAAIERGGPRDLPALVRDPQQRHGGAVGMLLHDWDLSHVGLRSDLERISEGLGVLGYPVALVSDLPPGTTTTALLRLTSAHGGGSELHFRSPAELAPPELLPEMWEAKPHRRLRFEALQRLRDLPPLPPTLRGSVACAGARTTGETYQRLAADAPALQEACLRARTELPRAFLSQIGDEGPPLSSRMWTDAMHGAGVNMRHLGEAASMASVSASSALTREALARTVKWLLRRALWHRSPWAASGGEDAADAELSAFSVAKKEAVAIFNLVLGGGGKAARYWEEVLVPETARRFRVSASWLSRRKVNPAALQVAMEHHCGVRFRPSMQMRQLFHQGWSQPFREADLSAFSAATTEALFPFLGALKRLWVLRLKARAHEGHPVPPVHVRANLALRGWHPKVKIACARGSGWRSATHIAARHVRESRWDRVYEVKKVELTVARALGESEEVVANILQAVAVALLEMAKQRGVATDSLWEEPGSPGRRQPLSRNDLQPEERTLRDALQCAEVASSMVPSIGHTWWAQLAAAECSFLLSRHHVAQTRLKLLRRVHARHMSDQTLLLLRLEGTFARLYALEGNWPAAALHTARCGRLADDAFGKSHPATVALRARVGDCWARHGDWIRSAEAYHLALAAAEAGSDVSAVARLSFELASARFHAGDVSAAKPYAEQAVRMLLPRFETDRAIAGYGSALALESLHVLAQVYEEIAVRAQEETCCLNDAERPRELMQRCIRCYETYLRHLPAEATQERTGVLSRQARVVESIVRMKALLMGSGERYALVDTVEEMVMHKSASTVGHLEDGTRTVGVRAAQPSSDTRALAEAALRSRIRDRPERLEFLYEAVAAQTVAGLLDPSDWYDEVVRKMSEGFAHIPDLEDPAYQATVVLMDICRYFGVYARAQSQEHRHP